MQDNLLADRYRITELLGEGGVGVVYKATDLQSGREVAVKFLVLEQTDDPKVQELRQRYFEREITLLSQIRHPAIVTVLDSGFTPLGLPYCVMEYIDGKTLAHIINKEGALIVGRAFRILQSLCSALECIHRHGAIHRDLKPENIMIVENDGREEIKLLDFGVAKMLEVSDQALFPTPSLQVSHAGAIMGTADYLAPEQWSDGELDQRTDIYALGLIAFEMLTRQHPFRSNSVVQSMAMHLDTEPPPPSSINEKVPIMLDEVILRSISKNKSDRQSSAVEFLAEFENVLADIYRRSLSYLSNPATETLSFDPTADDNESIREDREESEVHEDY
jgi:eukaryotic-like serine/threonine-protein kinase